MTTKLAELATYIKCVHIRRDGSRWIADLEMKQGSDWTGFYVGPTKRALIQHMEAVVGSPLQFGTDLYIAWF